MDLHENPVEAGLCPALHGAKPRAHTFTSGFQPCNKFAQLAFMGVTRGGSRGKHHD